MLTILKKALIPYSIGVQSLNVEKELASWSNDRHFKIEADGKSYSARFLKENRSPNNVFGEMNADILHEQTRFCSFLAYQQIPFMKLVPDSNGSPFTEVEWNHECYYFILFEWLLGEHITAGNEAVSYKFGRMARNIHDVAGCFESKIFTKKSHLVGYGKFIEQVKNNVLLKDISMENKYLLDRYLIIAREHIESAQSEHMDYIIQSDLNPLNILWDREINVAGIVDFESIGYGDRIEGLAWLVKWYSRIDCINTKDFSAKLAEAFLKGYQAEDFLLNETHYRRLASLIWLSGCMNWNFVKDITSINLNNNDQLKAYINLYIKRGQQLLTLVPKALHTK
jgi:Ser/Thr protein kinase RdoA (MazF antagonist)